MRTAFLRGIALATLVTVAAPGFAGEKDRARTAIAAARAKVEASAQVNTGGDAPRVSADARAALRAAEEQLARGHEKAAIDAANQAQTLAETAIGIGQRNQANVQAGAAAQANAAETQAAAAADQAAAANARADAAEQAAASAQADAAAARAAPPVVIAAPTPAPAATTTVRTETTTPAVTTTKRVAIRRVVRKPAVRHSTTARAAGVKTTTTVTTSPQ